MSIERDVFVHREDMKNPIEYVRLTDEIPIIFYFRDYSIPEGATAKAFSLKPSGNVVYQDAAVNGNTVEIDVINQMFAEQGLTWLQVELKNGTKTLVTFAHPVNVRPNYTQGDSQESQTVIGLFDQLTEEKKKELEAAAEEELEKFKESLPDDYTELSEKVEKLSLKYVWEKYAAIANGEYNLVYSDGEIQSGAANTTAPSSRILYKTLTLDSTTGEITLSEPLSEEKSTAAEMYENYAEYPYYYGDYSDGSTNGTIYKYKSMSRTISEGSYVTLTFWKWNSQKVSAEPESYEKGDFVETIYSDNEEDYPDDGVQDGYWYVRKKTKATLVSFDATGTQLTADNVQEALVELYNLIVALQG